ncbi:MAG: NADPH-dependent oxidoreductase [Chitinophagaceae bacterium]|nr:MAG: NADPH-dependent oxidoreductase [Chitinophagaceae bacterium]
MNDRYLIISGTNRKDSNTRKVAHQYQDALADRNVSAEILTLEGMDLSQHTPEFATMEKQTLLPAAKLIFVAPEYNGSIPGVLKTLLDLSDSHEHPQLYEGYRTPQQIANLFGS